MPFIALLNDHDTWSELEGCAIYEVPADWNEDGVDRFTESGGARLVRRFEAAPTDSDYEEDGKLAAASAPSAAGSFIMVLSDEETFTGLVDCVILEVPEFDEDRIEECVAVDTLGDWLASGEATTVRWFGAAPSEVDYTAGQRVRHRRCFAERALRRQGRVRSLPVRASTSPARSPTFPPGAPRHAHFTSKQRGFSMQYQLIPEQEASQPENALSAGPQP